MIKRISSLILALLLFIPVPSLPELAEEELSIVEFIDLPDDDGEPVITETDGSTTITITCTGDFTIGGDSRKKKTRQQFYKELEKHGDDINFTMKNVLDILQKDDLTLVNFEGTFTDTTEIPDKKKENEFLFNISPVYSNVLTDNSIEAVSLANNHVMDHGTVGYEDTKDTLNQAGVVFSTSEDIGLYSVKGITIAMLSYLCIDRYDKPVGGYDNLYDKVAADIAELKKQYPIVIVSFHWGKELDYTPNDRQKKMGRLAVDSGADLVIGHHSHRFNPIEQYNGVYICYSLGNFCFSGNDKPRDMSSVIFQTRFRISKNGDIDNTGFRIIPIRISSKENKNDYIPTPLTDDQKIESIISVMKKNGKGFGVEEYPLEWE